MNHSEARAFLYALRHGGSRYGRPRMWRMLESIGHPQWAIPSIHVAGTNGKGSTCAMLEKALRNAGFKTGLFTSPHLVYHGERIQVNRTILSEEKMTAYTLELKEVADAIFPEGDPVGYLSFFEFMTVMAFLHFARERVDISLIETGLGGRLDSTNVLKPLVCAVTSIGMDHTDILGDKIEMIAAEKAGIFHERVPAVIGPMLPEVNAVFEHICEEVGAPLIRVSDLYGEGKRTLPRSNLQGEHQQWNAALAKTVLEQLPQPFSQANRCAEEAFLEVDWQGRWQQLKGGDRLIWIDAAHNEAGVLQLCKLLEREERSGNREWTFIVGATGLERARAFLEPIRRFAKEVILIEPGHPRATAYEQWEELLSESGYSGSVARSSVKALFPKPHLCTIPQRENPILVTGSLYMIGEVLDRWENDPPVAHSEFQDR